MQINREFWDTQVTCVYKIQKSKTIIKETYSKLTLVEYFKFALHTF